MDKLKLIQIGVGGFGRSWLRTIKRHPGVRLVAAVDVADQHLEEARAILEDRSLPTFHDHREALRSVEADAAVVVTPPRTHIAIALDVLEAGLHLFMEKPLTYSFDEAKELYRSYRSYGKKMMINQNYRWAPPIQAVKRAIDSGAIGEIAYADWSFRRRHNANAGTWRQQSADFLFSDVSIHHFDLMRYFFATEPLSVNAQASRPSWSWCEGNLVGGAIFEFPANVTVYYVGSLAAAGSETTWNGDIRINGSRGAIELVDDIPVLIHDGKDAEPLPLPSPAYAGQIRSIDDFVRAVRQDSEPVTGLEDNIRSFLMVHAAIESSRQQRRVEYDAYWKAMQS